MEKILNFLGIDPCLSIQQADTLTAGPMVLTDVFYMLILLISFVNSSIVLKFMFNLINL